MVVRYPVCRCNNDGCEMRFLIKICILTDKCSLYILNLHFTQSDDDDDKTRRISYKLKKLIEDLVSKGISKPKKIHIALITNKDATITPTLEQIQKYMKYRRIRLGKVNCL
jgi:hypothetical protein